MGSYGSSPTHPLIIPIEDLIQPGSEWEDPVPLIKELLSAYRRTLGTHSHPLEEYRYAHTAYKMVGVGSVGTRCYIMLMLGRDDNYLLFLQAKEAQASVLERFLGNERVLDTMASVCGVGQCLMQAASDIFLGWMRIKGMDGVTRDYYVRQFQDWKGSADVDTMLPPGAPCIRVSAVRPSPGRTPAGATASPLPPTWAGGMLSTARSPTSPPRTPTRTSGITPRSAQPLSLVG